MPSPRDICARKMPYPSASAAQKALRAAEYYARTQDPHLRVYQCPGCHQWHWGHLPGLALEEAVTWAAYRLTQATEGWQG